MAHKSPLLNPNLEALLSQSLTSPESIKKLKESLDKLIAAKEVEATSSKDPTSETSAMKNQEPPLEDPKPFVTPPLSPSSQTKGPSPQPKIPSLNPKEKPSESKESTPQNSPTLVIENPNLIFDTDVVRNPNMTIALPDPEPLAFIFP